MDATPLKFLVYLIVTHKGVQYHSNVMSNSPLFADNLQQFKLLVAQQFNVQHSDGMELAGVVPDDITICNIMALMESQPRIVTPDFRHGRS